MSKAQIVITAVGSVILASWLALAQSAEASQGKPSGCPGESLIATSNSGAGYAYAWATTVNNGGHILSTRIGGEGQAFGRAKFHCSEGHITMRFREMSNDIELNCYGELEGANVRGVVICVDAVTGRENSIMHNFIFDH